MNDVMPPLRQSLTTDKFREVGGWQYRGPEPKDTPISLFVGLPYRRKKKQMLMELSAILGFLAAVCHVMF